MMNVNKMKYGTVYYAKKNSKRENKNAKKQAYVKKNAKNGVVDK